MFWKDQPTVSLTYRKAGQETLRVVDGAPNRAYASPRCGAREKESMGSLCRKYRAYSGWIPVIGKGCNTDPQNDPCVS